MPGVSAWMFSVVANFLNDANGPNAHFKNTLAFFGEIGHHAIYGHITPKKVFFVHIVVDNYVAIFAMPVAVSEIRVDQGSIFNI